MSDVLYSVADDIEELILKLELVGIQTPEEPEKSCESVIEDLDACRCSTIKSLHQILKSMRPAL